MHFRRCFISAHLFSWLLRKSLWDHQETCPVLWGTRGAENEGITSTASVLQSYLLGMEGGMAAGFIEQLLLPPPTKIQKLSR